MRVYLAGPWAARKSLVAEARGELRSAGFIVDCRWIDFYEAAEDESHEAVVKREAENDLDDIEAADALLVYNPGGLISEGKAFEQSWAYSIGMPVIIVGPYTNVFQRLDGITRVDTLPEAFGPLNEIRRSMNARN